MKAERPAFAHAMKAVRTFRETQAESLLVEDAEALEEVLRRLQRLDAQCGQLMEANNTLIEQHIPRLDFDPEADVLTVRMGGLEQAVRLKRADPEKPITMGTSTAGGAYSPKTTAASEQTAGVDKLAFEGLLEDYYHNAHRVVKIVQSLPGLKNFKCIEITMVRNKLVEHPRKGEVYSFGYSSSGPVVRPLHSSAREWLDQGLVLNTKALLDKLVQAFAATL